jgi:hypothetical protein
MQVKREDYSTGTWRRCSALTTFAFCTEPFLKGPVRQIKQSANKQTKDAGLAYWDFSGSFTPSLKPILNPRVRRVVGLVIMMGSDVPNQKLPITTVQVGSAVDSKAGIICSQRQSEHQGHEEEPPDGPPFQRNAIHIGRTWGQSSDDSPRSESI